MSVAGMYLDEMKKIQGFRSDAEAARFLGVTKQAFSHFRHTGKMDDSTALKLAKACNRKPEEVVLSLRAERARDKRTELFWKGLMKRVAIFGGTALLFTVNSENGNFKVITKASDVMKSEHCILCKIIESLIYRAVALYPRHLSLTTIVRS